jgi:hypothetical protein
VANVGCTTECVTDGVNGFTFRMGDASDLQRVMQRIIDQQSVGEASALYLSSYHQEHTAARIYAFDPQMKLIALLRYPGWPMTRLFGLRRFMRRLGSGHPAF